MLQNGLTQFRRSGQGAERRRRVLMDERVGSPRAERRPAAAVGDESAAPATLKSYTDEALAIHQRRITDFIPTRRWTLAVLLLTGLTIIAALESVYGRLLAGRAAVGLGKCEALDPTRPASLAGWFSALLLGTASLSAMLIYCLRRHKIDDYRGRYRMWLWIAALMLLGSIDAVAALHQAVVSLLAELARWPTSPGAPAFWNLVYAATLAAVGIRLAMEMRQCRSAVLALAAAAGGYVLAASLGPQEMPGNDVFLAAMAVSAATMLGHFAVLFSFTLYARRVYLDAQGVLPARREAPARTGKPDSQQQGAKVGRSDRLDEGREAPERDDEADLDSELVHADHLESFDASRNATSAGAEQAASVGSLRKTGENGKSSGGPSRRLSRAERRRLRKARLAS